MGRKVCVRAHCSEFRTVNSEHYRIRKLKIPKRRSPRPIWPIRVRQSPRLGSRRGSAAAVQSSVESPKSKEETWKMLAPSRPSPPPKKGPR